MDGPMPAGSDLMLLDGDVVRHALGGEREIRVEGRHIDGLDATARSSAAGPGWLASPQRTPGPRGGPHGGPMAG
eukprot:3457339-Lingulodinium_polyedra.AAC.1